MGGADIQPRTAQPVAPNDSVFVAVDEEHGVPSSRNTVPILIACRERLVVAATSFPD
jgi:hypothetical protein